VLTLSDELVETMAALQPVAATFKGVQGHDGEWDDWSPEGAAKVASTIAGFKERLRAASARSSGDRWERLAGRVMEDYLDLELDQYDQGDPLTDLNSIASPFQLLRMVFDSMDTSTAKGWSNVVLRLEKIGEAAERYRLKLEDHRRKGHLAAARQARAVLAQARIHAGDASFFLTLPDAMRRSGVPNGKDAELLARLEQAAPGARAVFGKLGDYLEQVYLPEAPARDAVGRERYLRHARRFLGMDLDADETYAWGWDQVRSISAEMHKVAGEILPGAPMAEVFRLLKTDPARCAKDPDDLVRLMSERQARALGELDGKHFDIPPQIRTIDVRIAPRGGPLGAYYVPPSEDFSRRGTVWYSLGDDGPFPLFDEITTAYHEGFPGHHLQCATQVSLTGLSRFQRLSDGYHGYAEGWALYAERLMHELGYFEKPDYVLGMLCAQLTRACRVVIDIGSHLDLPIPQDSPFHPGERWTFDLGVEMLRDLSRLEGDHSASEMTRYLGWPGQAIAYKVGERVILDLREDERRRLQGAFDLKDFHAKVVGSGPVALRILKDVVTEALYV
jgi:uncharacterized protein (DUF885 family)